MKDALFFIFLFLSLFTCAQKSFKVRGYVENCPQGTIFLISSLNSKDTLARTSIKNGKFRLTGKLSLPQPTYLRIANKVNGPVLFLENTNFLVQLKVTTSFVPDKEGNPVAVEELNNELSSIIQGGKDQTIANHFGQILSYARQAYDSLRPLYEKAFRDNEKAILKSLEKQDLALRQKLLVLVRESIRKYKDSYVSAYLIEEYFLDLYEDEAEAEELYELLAPQIRVTSYGESLAREIGCFRKAPQVNEIVPDFSLTTLEKRSLSLSNFPGKIKILDFWASYCLPCIQEIPDLLKFYRIYRPQGVEIVLISLETDPQITDKLFRKIKANWIYAGKFTPGDTDLASLFHITSIPYRILLDEHNRIIYKGNISIQRMQEIMDKALLK